MESSNFIDFKQVATSRGGLCLMSETKQWLKDFKGKISFADELEIDDSGSTTSETKFKTPTAKSIKSNYSSRDLKGLKVAHEFKDFEAGESDILVLDDSNVLGEGKDALVSLKVKEAERLRKHREIARHAKGYSGFKEYEEAAEEEGPVVIGGGANLKKKILSKYDHGMDQFTDEPTSNKEGFVIGSASASSSVPVNEVRKDTFDTVMNSGVDTVFKSKRGHSSSFMEKEKKRAKKLTKTLFSDEPEMMEEFVDDSTYSPALALNDTLDDDYEIQRIVSATRREHLKMMPIDLMNEMQDMEVDSSLGQKTLDSLMVDSIFVNEVDAFSDRAFDEENATHNDAAAQEASEEEFDNAPSAMNETDSLATEPLVRSGVAATLALLNRKGISLEAHKHSLNMNKSIGSDIKLEYFDDFGNKLSAKEAYKHLSRKFHGKGPGKAKLEKMKKRQEESQKQQQSIISASESAIVTNLRQQQTETGSAFVVLSKTRSAQTSMKPYVVSSSQSENGSASKQPKIFGLQIKK